MENILTLAMMVADTVKSYVTEDAKAKLLYTEDVASGTYSVLVVPNDAYEAAHVMLLVRVIASQVHVITDATDHPLEDALVQAGVPHQQIVSPRRTVELASCFPRTRQFY